MSQSAVEHATADSERQLTTKWLTFYVYFLFAWAIVLVTKAVLVMAEEGATAGAGTLLGLGPLAIFIAAVGFGLLWREPWGWKANWVLLFLPLTITTLFTIVAVMQALTGKPAIGLVTSKEALLGLYIGLALNVAWVWPNYVYFRKRRSSFRKASQDTARRE